jgi:GNAT superfamily N-acetyltransferase
MRRQAEERALSKAITIRRLQRGEGAALRDIRLRAIRDTPDAFAVSLAETLAQTDEAWAAWASRNAAGDASIMCVAEDAGAWIGMAGGMRDTSGPEEVAHLISMWVDPAYRGQGLGRRLVEHVVGWARDGGLRRLELWVTEHNIAAIELYVRCGFKMIGESQPLPSDAAYLEQKMIRDL